MQLQRLQLTLDVKMLRMSGAVFLLPPPHTFHGVLRQDPYHTFSALLT